MLIEKIESLIKRMQWKVYFFLNYDNKRNNTKKSFAFKRRYHLSQCKELDHFEKDLVNIINNAKFTNSFQIKPRTYIIEINNSRNIYVFADKTNNIYGILTSEHNKPFSERKYCQNLQKSSGKATNISQLGSKIHTN